jgi:hypothetical protein
MSSSEDAFTAALAALIGAEIAALSALAAAMFSVHSVFNAARTIGVSSYTSSIFLIIWLFVKFVAAPSPQALRVMQAALAAIAVTLSSAALFGQLLRRAYAEKHSASARLSLTAPGGVSALGDGALYRVDNNSVAAASAGGAKSEMADAAPQHRDSMSPPTDVRSVAGAGAAAAVAPGDDPRLSLLLKQYEESYHRLSQARTRVSTLRSQLAAKEDEVGALELHLERVGVEIAFVSKGKITDVSVREHATATDRSSASHVHAATAAGSRAPSAPNAALGSPSAILNASSEHALALSLPLPGAVQAPAVLPPVNPRNYRPAPAGNVSNT